MVLKPSARAFMATLNSDGLDEPSASGGIAVLICIIPALIASKTTERAESGGAVRVQFDGLAAGGLKDCGY